MGAGISTIGTQLLSKSSGDATFTKICNIKSHPALGGTPDMLETTDLEDTHQTFCAGVQSQDTMEFTANYTLSTYRSVLAICGTSRTFRLQMGANGADGIFEWTGVASVHVEGGDVNAVREMVITIMPSSAVEIVTTGTSN